MKDDGVSVVDGHAELLGQTVDLYERQTIDGDEHRRRLALANLFGHLLDVARAVEIPCRSTCLQGIDSVAGNGPFVQRVNQRDGLAELQLSRRGLTATRLEFHRRLDDEHAMANGPNMQNGRGHRSELLIIHETLDMTVGEFFRVQP